MNDHGWDVVTVDVFAKVFDPGVDAGYGADWRRADRHGPVGLDDEVADELSVGAADAVEVLQELHYRRRPIRLEPSFDPAEHARINTFRIVGCLDQVGSKCADEHGFVEPLGAVFADVSGDLTGTHRMTDERYIRKFQRVQQHIEIGGEGIVVVTGTWLAGPAKATTVVGDHAMARRQKSSGLLFPGIAVERPAMNEHDRQTGAVILVIEFDRGGVFPSDIYKAHGATLLPHR